MMDWNVPSLYESASQSFCVALFLSQVNSWNPVEMMRVLITFLATILSAQYV